MRNNIKSMLISSGVFVVFVALCIILYPIENDLEFGLAEFLLYSFLFMFFWILRSNLKAVGHWHFSGTAWLVFLMTLFGLWGAYYVFILHGNDSILNVSSTAPLTDTALMGIQLAVLYLISEGVIAVFAVIFRLLKKHTPPTA